MAAPSPRTRVRNVAVLVHNDVVKDARVLKEVETLGTAGHIVDVIGASSMHGYYPPAVPGARSLRILDISPRTLRGRFYHAANRLYPVILNYALAVSVILLLLGLLAYSSSLEELLRRLFIASPLALLVIRSMETDTPRRHRSVIMVTAGFFTVLVVIGTYGIVNGGIGFAAFLLVAIVLSGTLLVDFNLRKFLLRHVEALRLSKVARYRKSRWHAIAEQLASSVDPTRHDTVHCHDIIALIAGVALKKQYPDLRLVWDAHEYYEEVASASDDDRVLVREIIQSAEGRVDAFVTISESFREIYAWNYPGLPPALVVMNATRNAGVVENDGRLHRAAGLSADRRILLFQGGFSPRRGIGHLIEAARNLPDPWSIVMMGWGDLEPKIRAAAAELIDPGHSERAPLVVIPVAPHAELPYWSAGATLGAIPYEDAGTNHLYCTPNKLWEFPNAGVPILATALIEMERIIKTWRTGFLLPRDFVARDVLDRLAQVTEDDLAEARRNCRRFSEAMSWDRFEGELLKAYA